MSQTTRQMRGRPITPEEADKAVQRLINSHFHNPDGAIVHIPANMMDDDLVASDFIEQATEEIESLKSIIRKHSIVCSEVMLW